MMNNMIVIVNGNHVAVPQTETGCPIVPAEWIETTHISSPYPVYRSEQQVDWVVSPELLKPSPEIAQISQDIRQATEAFSKTAQLMAESHQQQVSQLTSSIGLMASVVGEMLEELASQNQAEQDPNNEGYLDD